ncbi:hypothetical protein [Dasania marina]|uniref:hypothetical protein n=1 Tax=Dasania marina TaxID=471499 RepID=UPI0030DB8CAF|tara:strand:- start:293 stop:811 length:519 start_codon:yes stop_codon:yes gene_type:complete
MKYSHDDEQQGLKQTEYDQHFASLIQPFIKAYAHLNPLFFADTSCLHTRIDIDIPKGKSLLHSPGLYADVLQTEHFIPVSLGKDGFGQQQQYVFSNPQLPGTDRSFELSATFGTRFIALQLKSEADTNNMQPLLRYALEIIDKLHERINRVTTSSAIKKLHNRRPCNRYKTG